MCGVRRMCGGQVFFPVVDTRKSKRDPSNVVLVSVISVIVPAVAVLRQLLRVLIPPQRRNLPLRLDEAVRLPVRHRTRQGRSLHPTLQRRLGLIVSSFKEKEFGGNIKKTLPSRYKVCTTMSGAISNR